MVATPAEIIRAHQQTFPDLIEYTKSLEIAPNPYRGRWCVIGKWEFIGVLKRSLRIAGYEALDSDYWEVCSACYYAKRRGKRCRVCHGFGLIGK